MKYFTLLLLFCALNTHAQLNLKFDSGLLEAEKNWVCLPMNKDSTYTYGFVYLDNFAGLTFHLDGSFSISKEGKVNLKKQPSTQMMKQRIAPTKLKVAIIPTTLYSDLQITATPEWLTFYNKGENDVGRLFNLGSTSNAWNQSEKALVYLEKVKNINPNYRLLSFEFAFAYNALKQFDKASTFLVEAIKKNPNDCLLYKELVYTQINLRQIDKAIETTNSALEACNDKNIKAEILRNITYYYYSEKDKVQFKVWAEKAKKEFGENVKGIALINKWEVELR